MEEDLLTPWIVRMGYLQGAFPMADDDGSIGWYRPDRRCLFPLEGIHVSRSLRKVIDSKVFELRYDTAFEDVVRNCKRPKDNWINDEIIRVFTEIHAQGWGHSVECWLDGDLVGGTYGIALGGCFCAESMFHRVTNASKVALWAAVEKCKELGFTIFDAEVMNPHLLSLGAFEIPHGKYMKLLKEAQQIQTPWSGPIPESSYF